MTLEKTTKSRKKKKPDLNKTVQVAAPADYPWKVLSALVADIGHYLDKQDALKISFIIRTRDEASYQRLAEDWGLQSIGLSDISLVEIRTKYLLTSLIKKFKFTSNPKDRIATAMEKFHVAEQLCGQFNTSGHTELRTDDFGAEILRHARNFLVRLLGPELPGSQQLLEDARHGPGASIGTKKGLVCNYFKYASWPYSCTIDTLRYAQFAIQTDQRWYGALLDSYREQHNIPQHYPLNMEKFWVDVIDLVPANRIAFVPKDARTERTIAIEPTLNLYLQLGVDGFIRRRLRRYGVNLNDQSKNQELARLGSLPNVEDQFCTIDLSAASDSISTKLCEMVLPSQWYSYLMDLRSPSGVLGKDGLISYEKISSMGNGYTFALESALFTAIVYAVFKVDGRRFDQSKFAVYGDDIIVPQPLYFKLVEALRLCGFRINSEKTFVWSHVRESCGSDWFQGKPLRPVFVKDMPRTVMDLFCDYNRIKRLLSLWYGLEDDNEIKVLNKIRSWIPKAFLGLKGPYSDEDFDSYIHCSTPSHDGWKRWVFRFQRLVIKPIPLKGNAFLFRKNMHNLRGMTEWETEMTNRYDHLSRLKGSGSRFTVTGRNALTVAKSYSVSDNWRSSYKE